MKNFRKICTITLCLAMLVATGCTRGSSTQQGNAGGGEQQSSEDDNCVMGIIREVTDGEYKISLNCSPHDYLIADKCGTDYKKGDSVRVSYAGEIRQYDNGVEKCKEENGELIYNEDYESYIKAEEYTGISLWENDYSFHGTLEAIVDMCEDEDPWEKPALDTCLMFVPLMSEDEGKANEILRTLNGLNSFDGYESQINGGAGAPMNISMHDMPVKITYDPETMLVTKVEHLEYYEQADIQ